MWPSSREPTMRRNPAWPAMRLKPAFFLSTWIIAYPCFAQVDGCDSLAGPASDETLIAWNSPGPVTVQRGAAGSAQTVFGQLRAVAIVKDGQIREPRNAVLERGASLWNVMDEEQELVLADIYAVNYLFRPGSSACLFSAAIDQVAVEDSALFANNREFHLRQATESEQGDFAANIYPESYCANRGGLFLRDTPPEDIPPCKEPKLIGLTDIDGDRSPEFWATEVLKYSIGIAVWERNGRNFAKIYSACPLCSD